MPQMDSRARRTLARRTRQMHVAALCRTRGLRQRLALPHFLLAAQPVYCLYTGHQSRHGSMEDCQGTDGGEEGVEEGWRDGWGRCI